MTTPFPDINCCIPDIVRVSESGSSPYRGNFRLFKEFSQYPNKLASAGKSAGTFLLD
jgi:hypothetical protein